MAYVPGWKGTTALESVEEGAEAAGELLEALAGCVEGFDLGGGGGAYGTGGEHYGAATLYW